MGRFHKGYFLAATGLLVLEIGIALFVHDRFVRPYAGDFLATIFLFWLAKAFVDAPNKRIAMAVLLVSYLIEAGQYFHLLSLVGLQHSRLARVVLGSSFEWTDLLAYTLGTLVAVGIEHLLPAGRPESNRTTCSRQFLR